MYEGLGGRQKARKRFGVGRGSVWAKEFMEDYSNVVVLESPESIERLLNRVSMLQVVLDLKINDRTLDRRDSEANCDKRQGEVVRPADLEAEGEKWLGRA
ncbi:hypothetical protein ACSQ67_021208 [Phaseolus vulgaris]